jgi:hypothetical protein
MVFAKGWGGSTQSERKIRRRGRQWSSPWTIIEEDRLLLPGGDLLNRGAWTGAFTINIHHIITDQEVVFQMSPEDSGFGTVLDIIDRSRTGDGGCT